MWYWIVMAVLVIGCIALLSGTFFSIKKNKAEEAAKRAEARATSLSFGPAKPTTQSPQKGG
jgi:flagellar basal body-associated protein FliL